MKAIRLAKCLLPVAILFLVVFPATVTATTAVGETFDTEPDPQWWTLSGSAAWDATSEGIMLTNSSPDQAGSIFWNWKLKTSWLVASFDFWIGDGSGGEGLTFAWVKGPGLLGQGGGALGFDGLDGYAIRFDTRSNTDGEPENYIAFSRSTPEGREDLAVNSDIPELTDVTDAEGKPAPFHVRLWFVGGYLAVFMSNLTASTPMPETMVLGYDIPEQFPDYTPSDAYFGFTAATSAADNVHLIDNVLVTEMIMTRSSVFYEGDVVTLGGGEGSAPSYTWKQIAGEPVVILDNPNPPMGISHFIAPEVVVPTILTFELTVELPEGPWSDTLDVIILPKSPPVEPPSNLRAWPLHLGFILEWDPLLDADEYIVEARISPGEWPPPRYTATPRMSFENLVEGQVYQVRVIARNQFGDSEPSEVLSFVAMRNLALPATLGGTTPPSDYVYAISHFDIEGMNNGEPGENNDSRDEFYKEEDYWGYLWPEPLTMDHVVYFTGDMLWDGGWFTDLNVQYTKDGTTWLEVPTEITPDYEFTNQREGKEDYARYDMRIPVLRGTGVRIYGTPGGVATFTSIAELEVYGDQVTPRPFVVQGIDGEVAEGGMATLDGSFTFSTRGDVTSTIWEQMSGPSVTINNAHTARATFDAPFVDADEVLAFRLTASDGTETLSDGDVRITVRDLVTTTSAGPDQSVLEGSEVILDGCDSLTTTGHLTFLWTQTGGPPVTLDDPSFCLQQFAVPILWDYNAELTFRLDVDDGEGGTSSDEVVVEVQNSLAWPNWKYTDAMAAGTGYMTDLLHLGNNPTDRILSPLNINYDPLAKFGGQAFVNPVPDEVYDFTNTGVVTTRTLMTWTPVHSSDGFFAEEQLDSFQQIYHIYVISPTERVARFHFPHDEKLRIWNNGELVVNRDTWDGGEEQTEDSVLADGLNSMTIKFEEGRGRNYLALGITDQSDQPFDDLHCSFGPSLVLTDAYGIRELPGSYEPEGTVHVSLSLRVNPDETPSALTISETIPSGLTVVDVGGGVVVGGNINWAFSGGAVATQMLSYTLGVPVGASGTLNFTGTVAFDGTVEEIEGDDVVYGVPSMPEEEYLRVDGLAVPRLKWKASDSPEVVGYNIYRSEDGGPWEKIAYATETSYVDNTVVPGKTYCYTVMPVNAAGVEGPWTSKVVCWPLPVPVEIREAEDYNEAFYHDVGGPPPRPSWWSEYRPPYHPDDPHIMPIPDEEDGWVIGYTFLGDWWTYDFQIPEAGWVKIELRVASPGGGRIEVYWDEVLFGNVEFVTGNWFAFEHVLVEDQVWSKSGVHTLKVRFASGQLHFDKFAIGLNWQGPVRETIFADDFESYTSLYTNDEVVDAGWTVISGAGEPAVAWQLWNTAGEFLKNEDPALAQMMGNYMITDSDFSETAVMDEHLITPEIDCSGYSNLRLDFKINHMVYPDDTDHLQIAEVDVRARDEQTGAWGEWINLLRLDTSVVADYYSGLKRIDLSAYDGRKIQVRWHFYDTVWDYWLAIDAVRISGEKQQQKEKLIRQIGVFEGKLGLTWDEFDDGNYTVEYTHDLAAGNWQPVPGFTWPILDTTWPGESIADIGNRFYRVRSE